MGRGGTERVTDKHDMKSTSDKAEKTKESVWEEATLV
jgi:hypothetical protein